MDFDRWLAGQAPKEEESKPAVWIDDEDLERMGIGEIEGRLFTRCCRCDRIFELDMSRKDAVAHGDKWDKFYCAGSDRCCP